MRLKINALAHVLKEHFKHSREDALNVPKNAKLAVNRLNSALVAMKAPFY
jgi:hypothetical protein